MLKYSKNNVLIMKIVYNYSSYSINYQIKKLLKRLMKCTSNLKKISDSFESRSY